VKPLTFDDLIPFEEYAARRAEFFDAHLRYRDRYRRVRVGPKLTLVFENRQMLWFRVQEFLRVARVADSAQASNHLDWYNRVLPKPDCLQAAAIVDGDPAYWRELTGDAVKLVVDSVTIPARLVTARSDDLAAGTAFWLEFALFAPERAALADHRRAARIEVDYRDYKHATAPLADEMRESLLDDLRQSTLASRAA
jgi:hypothetical protein